MARYIDADELKRLSIKFGEEQGKQRFSELLCEYVDCIPTADVVPKSEVEELKKKFAETEVELMNECLEKTNCDDMIQYILNFCFRRKVIEVFEEIEKIRLKEIKRCEVMREKEVTHAQRNYWEGGEHSLRQLSYWIAELKKKYTEEKE